MILLQNKLPAVSTMNVFSLCIRINIQTRATTCTHQYNIDDFIRNFLESISQSRTSHATVSAISKSILYAKKYHMFYHLKRTAHQCNQSMFRSTFWISPIVLKSFDMRWGINHRVNQFPMQLSRFSSRSFENAFQGLISTKRVLYVDSYVFGDW